MIIDFSSHFMTKEVAERLSSKDNFDRLQKNFVPESSDPEFRIALMRKYGYDMQVLTQSTPVLNGLKADEAAEICRISNDVIGKVCLWYPERFIPFAVVSLLDVRSAVVELDGRSKSGVAAVSPSAQIMATGGSMILRMPPFLRRSVNTISLSSSIPWTGILIPSQKMTRPSCAFLAGLSTRRWRS